MKTKSILLKSIFSDLLDYLLMAPPAYFVAQELKSINDFLTFDIVFPIMYILFTSAVIINTKGQTIGNLFAKIKLQKNENEYNYFLLILRTIISGGMLFVIVSSELLSFDLIVFVVLLFPSKIKYKENLYFSNVNWVLKLKTFNSEAIATS